MKDGMTGTGITFANGGVEFDGFFADIQEGRILVPGGESNWTSGNIRLKDPESILFNGGVFNLRADGQFVFGKGTFANAGTLTVDIPDGADPITIKSNLVNLGVLDLQGDKLVIGSDPAITGPGTEFNGNLTNQGVILFEIGGLTPGEEFDVLSIFETAILGGTLSIDVREELFLLESGQFFDIVIASAFQFLDGFTIGGPDGDKFIAQLVQLENDLQALRLVAAVPIPATVWLFGSALFGLLGIARRKSSNESERSTA